MIVKCPICKKPVEWSDLGEWASDAYVIHGNSYAQTNESEADKLAQELFSHLEEEKKTEPKTK